MIERRAHIPTPDPPQPPRAPDPGNPTDPQPGQVPPTPADVPPPIGDPGSKRGNAPVSDPSPDERPNPKRY